MERDAPNDGRPKRIVVDANNPDQVLPETKKPQVPQENAKKVKVISFIATARKRILESFQLAVYFYDLSLGDQIHNILFTAYNVLRQENNRTNGTLAARIADTDYKITFQGSEMTKRREDIRKIVHDTATEMGIPFGHYAQESEENWYGIAGPLLNFSSGFALRRKELRLGHHQVPLVRRENQEKVVNVAQYGIYGCHHILCEGISFPPEKRSSMVQSLGPMTIICLLNSEPLSLNS